MALSCILACALIGPWTARTSLDADTSCRLAVLDRQISQQRSRWVVRYRLAYEGDTILELSASDLTVDYEAAVSNSHCKPHTMPRHSQAHFSLSEASSVQTTVISGRNDRERCRERITLTASLD